MKTFSDFISQRFGYKENIEPQAPQKNQNVKSLKELHQIVEKILTNPNYQEEFVELIRNFIHEKNEDQQLQQMLANFDQNLNIANINPDRGLATFDGEANQPSDLPPNMGG